MLFERQRALFVGDALCTENPLTGARRPQLMPSAMNVSNEDCLRSLAAIEELAAEVMLVGHGEPWRETPAAAVARARGAA